MTDQPEPTPTPKKRIRKQSPYIHDLPPSGQGCVIGGVSGFRPPPEGKPADEPPPATDETPGKPTMVLPDAMQAERSRTEKEPDSMSTASNKQMDSTSSTGDDRLRLYLLVGPQITFENVMKMFESLVGRPATPEERAEAWQEWQSDNAQSDTESTQGPAEPPPA